MRLVVLHASVCVMRCTLDLEHCDHWHKAKEEEEEGEEEAEASDEDAGVVHGWREVVPTTRHEASSK